MKGAMLAALLLCVPAVYAGDYLKPTAEQFAAQVNKQGSAKTISAIPAPEGDKSASGEWAFIMDKISSGDPEWLKIVPGIMPADNGRWSSDIAAALTEAIPLNAGGVMSVMDDKNFFKSTKTICSMPIYTGSGSVGKLNNYFVRAVQALYKENSVQAQKCLVQIVNTVGQSEPFKEIE